ncbi:MAG: DNA adenine methylase [Thermoguttaceae bacterium]|nr:DNA adenine methylase [Thermoguttaceae bacterium]
MSMLLRGFVESPLNYTGGKFRILSQITPLFPEIKGTFIDLFCGGCNVGINAECEKVVFNDINGTLIDLFKTFKMFDKDELFQIIDGIIDKYGLSRSDKYGYEAYKCDSSSGLGSYNKPRFLRLRDDYNNNRERDSYRSIMLYVLIVYSFNNQIRFNKKNEFNLPVGKRDFNRKMQRKLLDFVERLQTGNYEFSNKSFKYFDTSNLGKDDFIYADPPYLITCATYNDQIGWNWEKELQLLQFLDSVDACGIRFALSNVLSSEGKTNRLLNNWVERNAVRYFVHHLDFNYSNSSYHKKDKTTGSDEVLITNY